MTMPTSNPKRPALKIHPIISSLIQPISQGDYEALELDLLEYGCREPIVTWSGYILDGHKRYAICMDYGIPFPIRKSHLATLDEAISYVCEMQLGRKDLKYERYKYLIGKWFSAQKVLAKKEAERSLETDEPITPGAAAARRCEIIAKAEHVSCGTVHKYRLFQESADYIAKSAPQLFHRIISGQLKLSHENTLELCHRSPEDLRTLEKAVLEENLSHLSLSDIRHEISWFRADDQYVRYPVARKENKVVNAQIKEMPQYDPDAEISSLAYTIPSWCSMINRSMKVSNLSQVSPEAKKRLLAQLETLMSQTERLLVSIKES